MTAEKELWRVRCAEETTAWADEVTENLRLRSSEPQGEPSDAQVKAAKQSLGHLGASVTTPMMRAALRAASSVTEQGENTDG